MGAHFTLFLCHCSVLRVFKIKAIQIRGMSEQALESMRIELGTSATEASAFTNCATPAIIPVSDFIETALGCRFEVETYFFLKNLIINS